MSLFIGNLVLGEIPLTGQAAAALLNQIKSGILLGSLLAGLTGYSILRLSRPSHN